MTNTIKFNKVHPDALVPTYGTDLSAGFDLALVEDVWLLPQQSVIVSTGLIIQAPPGHFILVAPRSSTFKKYKVSLGNTIGIVDADYCGPEDVMRLYLFNPAMTGSGQSVGIPAGTRIAQGVFVPFTQAIFELVEGPIAPTRGGWGSTGD